VTSLTSAPAAVAASPRGLGRLLTQLRVHVRRGRLDAMLADGHDPWSSPELLRRGAQLSSLAERRKLAAGLEGLVTITQMGRSSAAYVRVRYGAVMDERDALAEIAARLRAPAPVDIQVLAAIAVLVWDGSSPVFVGGRPARGVAQTVRRCMDGWATAR
jgi:hypothetical protein